MSATLSIGVGRGSGGSSGERTLGPAGAGHGPGTRRRPGGCEAEGDTYEFFGGLSKGVEKRDKVRTRVIAATLSDHIKSSDRGVHYGTQEFGPDCIGAAVGMWAAIRKGLEKQASIVVNRNQTLAGALIDSVEESTARRSFSSARWRPCRRPRNAPCSSWWIPIR